MRSTITSKPFHITFDADLPYTVTKTFRLFSSFPLTSDLTQGVIVAKDGTCFRLIGLHSLFPKKRQEVNVPVDGNALFFDSMGFSSVEPLDAAPHKVVEEMFT